ncbi:MAG: flagellar filament capping protein FliD [Holophagaceae bacterium]|nr:flagellar filament capping protein FliD [Holophagaceae bacterium]
MALSFGGISSGIDTSLLVQSILEQEYRPVTRLQDRQDLNNAKKNALSSIKTSLMALATSFTSLNATAVDRRTITSSDNNIVSATGSGAAAGKYDVEVTQLATKARAESVDTIDNPTKSIGPGEYTLTNKDGETFKITLQTGDSLKDLVDAINAAKTTDADGKEVDFGVSASIVQKRPGEYVLSMSSTDEGLGKDGGGSISIFGDAFGSGFAQTVAQNAKFSLNGVEMERNSNTISDAVDGVTFTLKKEGDASLSVAMDKDYITKAFQDLVDKFNAAYKAYQTASAKGAPLANDATMRTMFTQLRSAMSVAIEGENGNILGSTSGLGLSTNRDGTLSLDTKKLSEALDKDPALVGQIFQKASTASTDFIDKMTIGSTASLNLTMSSIDTQNSNLSKQIDDMLAKLDRRKEVLTAQFARMESVLGQLQAAGQSLGGLSYY